MGFSLITIFLAFQEHVILPRKVYFKIQWFLNFWFAQVFVIFFLGGGGVAPIDRAMTSFIFKAWPTIGKGCHVSGSRISKPASCKELRN